MQRGDNILFSFCGRESDDRSHMIDTPIKERPSIVNESDEWINISIPRHAHDRLMKGHLLSMSRGSAGIRFQIEHEDAQRI